MTIEIEKKEDTGCFFKFIGSCIGVLVFTVLFILKLTNVIDWSWNWVILALIIAVCILAYAAFHFFAEALDSGFANKFSMDKYDYLKSIAKKDEILQKQKDEFDRNVYEIKISKTIQDQDIELYDVNENIGNLIYPNKIYSSVTCPDCGKNPFWILSEKWRNNQNSSDIKVRYYAICSNCTQIVHYYYESIYERLVIKRIEKMTEKQ